MKFKYFIVGTLDDYVRGANELSIAKQFTDNDAYYVIDCATGEILFEDQRDPIIGIASEV